MKFLIRSDYGESLPLALRLLDEGNEVKFSIAEVKARDVGDGLVEKPPTFERAVQWADVVVFDSNCQPLPEEAERVRAMRPVVGSSALSHRLEEDRQFAISEARKAGLSVPDSKEFSGPRAWAKAREFIGSLKTKDAWVWKPNGEAPCQTFVAENAPELHRMLDYWKRLYEQAEETPSFILTPKIEGVEVSTEAWFNGHNFTLFNHTIERNRLFDGDRGEKTGCAGNVVWLSPDSRLARDLLLPLAPLLQGKYYGPVDVNAIIENGTNVPVFLEFSPRFGYDAIFAFMELIEDDFGGVLYAMATGHDWTGKTKDDFAGALRIHIPPFPEGHEGDPASNPSIGVPIFGYNPDKFSRHVQPIEVRLNVDGEPVTSGPDGYVFVVSNTGDTPLSAMEAAYSTAKQVRIPCMRYRGDLGERIQKVYDDLENTGWLESESGRGTDTQVDFDLIVRRAYGHRRSSF